MYDLFFSSKTLLSQFFLGGCKLIHVQTSKSSWIHIYSTCWNYCPVPEWVVIVLQTHPHYIFFIIYSNTFMWDSLFVADNQKQPQMTLRNNVTKKNTKICWYNHTPYVSVRFFFKYSKIKRIWILSKLLYISSGLNKIVRKTY